VALVTFHDKVALALGVIPVGSTHTCTTGTVVVVVGVVVVVEGVVVVVLVVEKGQPIHPAKMSGTDIKRRASN